MKAQINLASHNYVQKVSINRFTLVAGGVLVISFIISGLLIIYSLVLASQSAVLDSTRDQYVQAINKDAIQKGKILILEDRLASINTIIAGRNTTNTRLQAIFDILPSSMGVEGIDADAAHATLKISGPLLSDFDSLFQTKIPELVKGKTNSFRTITIDSFGIEQDTTNYNASLTFK